MSIFLFICVICAIRTSISTEKDRPIFAEQILKVHDRLKDWPARCFVPVLKICVDNKLNSSAESIINCMHEQKEVEKKCTTNNNSDEIGSSLNKTSSIQNQTFLPKIVDHSLLKNVSIYLEKQANLTNILNEINHEITTSAPVTEADFTEETATTSATDENVFLDTTTTSSIVGTEVYEEVTSFSIDGEDSTTETTYFTDETMSPELTTMKISFIN